MPASNRGIFKNWWFKIDRFSVVWRRVHNKEKYEQAPKEWADELLLKRKNKVFPFTDDK